MSRQALRPFLAPQKLSVLLPLLERNLAKLTAESAATPAPRASVAAVFRWREREQRTLELLLVRRSINERDAWSGQVAFPGGKRQKRAIEGSDPFDIAAIKANEKNDDVPWESPRETATRETMEEIGLDLTAPNVRWIGSLPAIQTHLRTFWVSTQVFVMETPAEEQELALRIQESEIADVFWVDIQEFFNPTRFQPLVWPIEDMIRPLATRPRLKEFVRKVFGDLVFKCIYLPRPTHALPDEDMTVRHPFDFILWGLTLRMISDLFVEAKVPLPENDVMPHFESRLGGDLALFLYRYPDKALMRGASIAALAAAASFGLSRL
ncbi:Nudix hydrolase, partial [Globisporangium splendens]